MTVSRSALYIVALLVVILDQASKAWLRATMPLNDTVPLWLGVFHITHTRNIGAAFSLLQGKTWLLVGSALVVIAVIMAVAQRYGPGRMPLSYALALGLPLGGAIGNLMDRLRLGYVTDLFDFTLINFPVFNVADSAITIGIVILLWRTLFAADGAGRIIATTTTETAATPTNAPVSPP